MRSRFHFLLRLRRAGGGSWQFTGSTIVVITLVSTYRSVRGPLLLGGRCLLQKRLGKLLSILVRSGLLVVPDVYIEDCSVLVLLEMLLWFVLLGAVCSGVIGSVSR